MPLRPDRNPGELLFGLGPDLDPGTSDLLRQEAANQRRAISEEILAAGCVQSFVDFFYLTHRPDPKACECWSNPEKGWKGGKACWCHDDESAGCLV